jgi:hypothetical protein
VPGGQIDLIGDAVEPERHGLVCSSAVDVVDQQDLNLLRHCVLHHADAGGMPVGFTIASAQ